MNDRVVDKIMYLSACVEPYLLRYFGAGGRALIPVKIDGDLCSRGCL